MNAGPELEADLQSQASSPAQNNQSEGSEQAKDRWGEQRSKVTIGSEQNGGEQAAASNGVSKSGAPPAQRGEQRGEQRMENGEGDDRRQIANKPEGKDRVMHEHSAQGGERRGEQDKKDYEAGGEQPLHTSQWLKSLLPEASNGWWDVRDKGNRIAIMFRWRDPELQVLTPLRVPSEEFETLKQSDYEDAKSRIKEQISLRLHNLSLDPAKRDKALIVAQKLGIDLGEYQVTGVGN